MITYPPFSCSTEKRLNFHGANKSHAAGQRPTNSGMPQRVLAHKRAPTTETGMQGMTAGQWADVSQEGQFLIDLEFLTLHTQPPVAGKQQHTETACVYTQSPSYLVQIACQFPWVHFYCFRHRVEGDELEYDPERPAVRRTLQTEHNRTTSPFEFSKDSAITLSKAKEARPEHRLVMICHGETEMRQVVLHALLRADYSLLDICGCVQEDYLEGEIVLPIMLPQNKALACLVATHPCKCATYDPNIYRQEMGFFQGTLRTSEAYDQASKHLIIAEYGQRFQQFHKLSADTIAFTLQMIIDYSLNGGAT